ncbi:hypothetical protein ACFP8W_26175, partial [Nocardioides hankookensis]
MSSTEPRLGRGWYAFGGVVRQLFRVVLLLQLASVAIAVWGIGTFDAWTATTGIADATQQYDTVKRASGRLGLAVELVAGLALAGWLYR